MKNYRVNDELSALLQLHAKADGRSATKELEIILVQYFDGIDNPTPKTTAALRRPEYDYAPDEVADTIDETSEEVVGMPCCTDRRPCKHWLWDEMSSVYRNSLTGAEREPV